LRIKIGIGQELMVTVSAAVLLMLVIYVFQAPSLRLGLGLVYLLFMPGYVTLTALFPGKDDLRGIERVALSFVLSLAIVSLIGLGLNFTPWGVRLAPILVSVISFTLLAAGLGTYRRARLQPAERYTLYLEADLPEWQPISRLDTILGAALAVSVLFVCATVGYLLVNPKISERYTEFYLLGPGGRLEGYPTEVSTGTPIAIVLGVANHEHDDVRYRIERRGDGASEQLAAFQLGHEETWEQPYTFTLTQPGEDQKVEFLLYRGDEEEPLRSLYLMITATEG
jgi:uncharacterized membrane protein